ncbi:hypothetical protein L6452_40715 [Arctium lappa]|uniref:Uncharacterized protein n=1 Tax=Arctium lappa TaxID=4217 RepID=A0ACB8XMN0_ARCLA|nr:hypothetical protein L6452_40715 [Arctium lappa]
MGGGEGREGDWECNGCGNRNYAFRSFCNRCKQPRLLVDSKTPADSKWLPRIGDWICTGCTNNNYASREKCKKCGQPKEVAAMPALAMPGATLRTQLHYFPRAQGVQDHRLNMGLLGNGTLQQSLPLSSHWLLGRADKFGLQTATTWPLGGNATNAIPYINQVSQVMVPKGWRNGDWICACGFHNYASRAQCKKCNASMPPALGTKRLASEELVQDWDNKRLNAGQTFGMQPSYSTLGQLPSSSYSTPTQIANFVTHETAGGYPSYPVGRSTAEQTLQLNLQTPQIVTMPALPGKGAKQWRDGDWMCTNCNNHNYASRSKCNKCNAQREGPSFSVTVG